MNAADLAELCASALPDEDLTAEDLETCCFGPGAEIVAADDGAAAVVYVVREFDHAGGPGSSVKVAWLLLVVVAPGARRTGQARALVGKVVEWCQDDGVVELHTGNAAPRYLWAGVDLSNAAALAFFQDLGFEPYDHALNMRLPTSFRAPVPPGVEIVREDGDGAAALARRAFPNWEDEVRRGTDRGTAFAARDATGATIAFACHSVNRHAWIGPMATDPARRHAGTGHALLGALTADIEATYGVTHAEISWVAPIGFYAHAGATAHRAFRMHRLPLTPAPAPRRI